MANPYINMNHVTEVTLHEGWLEHKSFHEYKWKKSWLILQGNAISFFHSQNTTQEPRFGILTIDKDFKFVKKDEGSPKSGYKFELRTSRAVTKFKASKFSERELWKAYLEGIATGQVSDKIDLPPEILVQIRLLLEAQHVNAGRRSSLTDRSLGGGSLGSADSVPPIPPPDDDGLIYNISNDDVSADSGCVDDFYLQPANSHLLNYVFYNDAHKRELPTWFFQNCSREQAEEILVKGTRYGNTLMRKGSSNTSNLVISKKMEGRKEDFSHFVIDIKPDGYKLLVENPHQPMKCLTDIMNFFVLTSGQQTTKPMTCNNLYKIGISPEHIYNPVIIPSTPKRMPVERKESDTRYAKRPLPARPGEAVAGTPEYVNMPSLPMPNATIESEGGNEEYVNMPSPPMPNPTVDIIGNGQTYGNVPPPPNLPAGFLKSGQTYGNIPSAAQEESARPWLKNRSQSIPNIVPLVDFQPDLRRLSVYSEALRVERNKEGWGDGDGADYPDKSPSPTSPRARFLHTVSHPPPPPTTNSPTPPPPPPPTTSPPKLPGTSNKSRVSDHLKNTSPPPPLSEAPAPPLPGGHPPPLKAQTQMGSTLSLASQFDEITQKRNTPPVAPKPIKKDHQETLNGKKIGDAPRSPKQLNPSKKENNGEVIYAKIMKIKKPLKQSKSVPASYENWKTAMKDIILGSNESKDRLSSLNETKLTYADIDPEPYVLYQDAKQSSYEPVNLKSFEEESHSICFQAGMGSSENDSIKSSSYETYEISESVFGDRPRDNVGTSTGNSDARENEVFQKMNFYSEDFLSKTAAHQNESKTNLNGMYASVGDKFKVNRIDSKNTKLHYSPKSRRSKSAQYNFSEVENEYETIRSVDNDVNKEKPPATKPRTIIGIPSPGDIYYESVEWRNKVNRPRIPSPKPRRRTNSLTWKTEKHYDNSGATKKSSTLNALDDLKFELLTADEKYYDEVVLNGKVDLEQMKSASNYVDVIADYEDIKAARMSQKRLAERKLSVPEDEFKRKLEKMFEGSKAKTMPAIRQQRKSTSDRQDLKSVVNPTPSPLVGAEADVVYDDLEGYLNPALK